jgi:hypothetical protein
LRQAHGEGVDVPGGKLHLGDYYLVNQRLRFWGLRLATHMATQEQHAYGLGDSALSVRCPCWLDGPSAGAGLSLAYRPLWQHPVNRRGDSAAVAASGWRRPAAAKPPGALTSKGVAASATRAAAHGSQVATSSHKLSSGPVWRCCTAKDQVGLVDGELAYGES